MTVHVTVMMNGEEGITEVVIESDSVEEAKRACTKFFGFLKEVKNGK